MAKLSSVPLEFAQKLRHLPELLALQARSFPNQVLWRTHTRQLTTLQWHTSSLQFAAKLIRLGVQPGEPVGLRLAEGLDWPIALFGIWSAGAVALPLPITQSITLTSHFLARAQVKRVVVARHNHPLKATFQTIAFSRTHLRPWQKVTNQSKHSVATRLESIGPHSIALLAPTSGKTGAPKLARLSHNNLLRSATARAELVRHQPFDRVLSWLPLSHLYALNADLIKGLLARVEAVRLPGPKGILRALRHWSPTHFQAVPRLYEKIWHLIATQENQLTSLKIILGGRLRWAGCGGAPLPDWLAQKYARLGLPILEGYGLTEASPLVTMNTPEACKPATAGRVVPGMRVQINDDGEILVAGAGVMPGYHNDAKATADTLRDGWLHTGDIGQMDGDFLRVTGRKSDTILLSTGRKVMPAKVESALLALPWVENALVFGEGQARVAALIQPKANSTPNWVPHKLPGLEDHEQPARLVPLPRPLSLALGEITPLGKMNRSIILRNLKPEFFKEA